MEKALITGITGQDGSFLAELLLEKGYEVHGIVRRSSTINRQRLSRIYSNGKDRDPNLYLYYGDMTDSSSLIRILTSVEPNEIYNLAAQSHVKVSFEIPEYTANSDALGVLRMLEVIKQYDLKSKFYQASTSELFGLTREMPQKESTSHYPRSPYAVAKLYAYWIVINYREAYNIYACNGILFNHESERRGENFVTKKITKSIAEIKSGLRDKLYLGNLDAKRDWGYAKDYVEAMWLMMQQDEPDDYVIATGETHSVKEFVELAFARVGIEIEWVEKGLKEKGLDKKTGNILVEVDPSYFRPTDVNILLGDASKAEAKLNWKPKMKFKELVNLMMDYDMNEIKKHSSF